MVAPAALVVTALALAWFKVADQDVFWHLKVGEVMLDTGRLVTTNVFSSLFHDHPWFNPEWGFQVLLATTYRQAGWPGVALLKLLLVAALAVALYLALQAVRRAPVSAALLGVAVLAATRFRLMERPQLASYVLFAATVLLAERYRRRGGRALWALPPLFALWSNLHPELLLGILFLLGMALGEWLNDQPGSARNLSLAALGCLAASLLNPAGWRVLAHPFPHFSQDAVVRVVEFEFSDPRSVPLFWLLGGGALTLVAASWRRRDWAELLTLAGMLLLSARYRREVPYGAIAAALTIQKRLPEVIARPGIRRALLALTALAALVWAWRYDALYPYRPGWGVDARLFPVGAVDFLERHELPDNVYNNYNQSGYLIYRFHPRRGVFQDSRISAYPAEFMTRIRQRISTTEWNRIFDDGGVNTALIPSADVLSFRRRFDWGVVYWDEEFALLLRRNPGSESLLSRLEYRYFLPGNRRSLMMSGDPAVLAGLLREMTRNLAERTFPSPDIERDREILLRRLGRRVEGGAARR